MSELLTNGTLTVNPIRPSSIPKQQSILVIGNYIDRQHLIKSLIDNDVIVNDYNLTMFVGIEGSAHLHEISKNKQSNNNNIYNNCKGAVLKGFDKEILTALVDGQKYSKFQTHKTVILDNCFTDNSILKDNDLLDFFYNSRHYNTSYVLSTNNTLSIPPEIRCNFDMIFLLPEESDENIKKLHRFYGGYFEEYAFFKQTFQTITKVGHDMVIWNRGSMNDVVYYYSHNCPNTYGHFLIKNDTSSKLKKIVNNEEKQYNKEHEQHSIYINIENIQIENLTITSEAIRSIFNNVFGKR